MYWYWHKLQRRSLDVLLSPVCAQCHTRHRSIVRLTAVGLLTFLPWSPPPYISYLHCSYWWQIIHSRHQTKRLTRLIRRAGERRGAGRLPNECQWRAAVVMATAKQRRATDSPSSPAQAPFYASASTSTLIQSHCSLISPEGAFVAKEGDDFWFCGKGRESARQRRIINRPLSQSWKCNLPVWQGHSRCSQSIS